VGRVGLLLEARSPGRRKRGRGGADSVPGLGVHLELFGQGTPWRSGAGTVRRRKVRAVVAAHLGVSETRPEMCDGECSGKNEKNHFKSGTEDRGKGTGHERREVGRLQGGKKGKKGACRLRKWSCPHRQ